VFVLLLLVMPGLVPGIHAFTFVRPKDVDGRDFRREDGASRLSPGHDESVVKRKSAPVIAGAVSRFSQRSRSIRAAVGFRQEATGG
jgi:hypothetical protein